MVLTLCWCSRSTGGHTPACNLVCLENGACSHHKCMPSPASASKCCKNCSHLRFLLRADYFIVCRLLHSARLVTSLNEINRNLDMKFQQNLFMSSTSEGTCKWPRNMITGFFRLGSGHVSQLPTWKTAPDHWRSLNYCGSQDQCGAA